MAVAVVVAAAWAAFAYFGRPKVAFEAEYDKDTRKLTKLVTDLNKNGVPDTTSYMDGAKFVRIEIDFDENGKTERWDFYKEDGKTVEKVGLASRNDGVMDNVTYYNADGTVARILVSTKRDKFFDRTEFYEAGILKRNEEDTNRDGKPDKWDTFAPVNPPVAGLPPYTIVSSAFDDSGSGRPERRMIFGPNGQVLRVEVDKKGDGVFTLLSGNPVKR